MVFIETLLCTLLLVTSVYVSVTDIRWGIIENKVLLISGTLCGILNAFYYIFFARAYFQTFFINLLLLVSLSIGLYALHLWAAGDSKLLILMAFAIPGRWYHNSFGGAAPEIYIVIFTFALSFIYVVAESGYLRIKNGDRLPKWSMSIKTICSFCKNFIGTLVYIMAFNDFMTLLFPVFIGNNTNLLAILDLFFSIMIYQHSIFFRLPVFGISLLFSIPILFIFGHRYGLRLPSYLTCGYIAVVLFIRMLSEQYNYQTIPTADVCPGMILSFSTVAAMSLSLSQIYGLPRVTTEDMRSRLTVEEVKAIQRWKDSIYGQSEITIVRKIPFAIFITLGAALFILFIMYYI